MSSHEDRARHLEHGLRLIISEARQFPEDDGIGAGRMATNILRGAPDVEPEEDDADRDPDERHGAGVCRTGACAEPCGLDGGCNR